MTVRHVIGLGVRRSVRLQVVHHLTQQTAAVFPKWPLEERHVQSSVPCSRMLLPRHVVDEFGKDVLQVIHGDSLGGLDVGEFTSE